MLTRALAQVTEQTPGVYVPQVGDRVVYLQQGHKLYHERLREKRRGPWDTIVSTAVTHSLYTLQEPMNMYSQTAFQHALHCTACLSLLGYCLPCCCTGRELPKALLQQGVSMVSQMCRPRPGGSACGLLSLRGWWT